MAGVQLRIAAVFSVCLLVAASTAGALDATGERAAHLLELAVAYGDNHLVPASNLVMDTRNQANIPDYSLPYAIALLELDVSNSRAKAVLTACLGAQDTDPKSPTAGQFRETDASDGFSVSATAKAVALLSRAVSVHGAILGDDFRATLQGSLELGARAITGLLKQPRDDDEALALHAAAASAGMALGDARAAGIASQAVRRWSVEIAREGRTWGPSPHADVLRILYLQWLWDACTPELRPPVDELLHLCYADLAQRLLPNAALPAGAVFRATPEDFLGTGETSASLIYRDFGGPLPTRVAPFAAAFGLSGYRPPASVARCPSGDFQPYQMTTQAQRDVVPAQTDTYVAPGFTLGSMSGWCLPGTLPIMATFAAPQQRPTMRFMIHGAPAYMSSFQFGNLAICSLNFDRMGVGERLQAYLRGALGNVHDIQEIYAMGERWNGEPIAIGARANVIIKRAGFYVAITLLDGGTADSEADSRRKPGVLEWTGIGEQAELTLTAYARQEEYRLRQPADDLRTGLVVQVWDATQFASIADMDSWLARSKINQRQSSSTERTYLPKESHPVLDRNKPAPKGRTVTRTVALHTIEYSYLRGKGDVFILVEDVRNERVVSRSANGVAVEGVNWWLTPAFALKPGQSVTEALAPAAPAPPPAPVESPPAAATTAAPTQETPSAEAPVTPAPQDP